MIAIVRSVGLVSFAARLGCILDTPGMPTAAVHQAGQHYWPARRPDPAAGPCPTRGTQNQDREFRMKMMLCEFFRKSRGLTIW